MKKEIIFLILLISTANTVYADNVITIPADFLTKVARSVEFKTETNFIQKLLINQIINSSTINGVALKDIKNLNTGSLIDIFTANGVFKKISDTKLIEPNTGATLVFDTAEGCKNNSCTVIVDLNGDNAPNELWTDTIAPKDRIKFSVQKDENEGLKIVLPDYIK